MSKVVSSQLPVRADTNNIVYRAPEISCKQEFFSTPYPSKIELVKGSGSEIFLIQNGVRRWITDSKTFDECGFDFNQVKQIFDEELERYPEGLPISNNGTLVRSSQSDIYIIVNGVRRQIPVSAFNKYQFSSESINLVNDEKLLSIPEGPAWR
ncbi:MAG TPA: hypothetical protein V6C91_19040 [Coleofasciculaceae cyanobacterium]